MNTNALMISQAVFVRDSGCNKHFLRASTRVTSGFELPLVRTCALQVPQHNKPTSHTAKVKGNNNNNTEAGLVADRQSQRPTTQRAPNTRPRAQSGVWRRNAVTPKAGVSVWEPPLFMQRQAVGRATTAPFTTTDNVSVDSASTSPLTAAHRRRPRHPPRQHPIPSHHIKHSPMKRPSAGTAAPRRQLSPPKTTPTDSRTAGPRQPLT